MADRQRAGRIVAGGLVLWLASCAEPAASELVVEQRMPVQPEVTVAATEQMRAAPSRSSALRDGACATQADCSDPSSICYNNTCLPSDCGSTRCDAGEVCYNGVCYEDCSDGTCDDPSHIC